MTTNSGASKSLSYQTWHFGHPSTPTAAGAAGAGPAARARGEPWQYSRGYPWHAAERPRQPRPRATGRQPRPSLTPGFRFSAAAAASRAAPRTQPAARGLHARRPSPAHPCPPWTTHQAPAARRAPPPTGWGENAPTLPLAPIFLFPEICTLFLGHLVLPELFESYFWSCGHGSSGGVTGRDGGGGGGAVPVPVGRELHVRARPLWQRRRLRSAHL